MDWTVEIVYFWFFFNIEMFSCRWTGRQHQSQPIEHYPAGGAEIRLDLIDGLNGGKLFIFGSSSILKCFLAGSKQKITQGVSMKDAKIQINLCIYAWSVDYSIVLKYIVSCLILFLFLFFTFKKYKYKGNPCQFFFRQWHTGPRESLYFGHFFRRPPPTPYLEGR